MMKFNILHGDNRLTLKTLDDNSVDAIVTDPPYGIDFLGKAWDANTGALETYQECLRVLKPGGQTQPSSEGRFPSNVLGEVEGYQKFFYCPKVSRKERHIGFDTTDIPTNPDGMYDTAYNQNDEYAGKDYNAVREQNLKVGNNHPTVKPVELMKYLIKLVTPPNSTVLDPFSGSGSTGMAAVELGHTYIGCELDPNYVDIAKRRIEAWNTPELSGTTYEELFE